MRRMLIVYVGAAGLTLAVGLAARPGAAWRDRAGRSSATPAELVASRAAGHVRRESWPQPAALAGGPPVWTTDEMMRHNPPVAITVMSAAAMGPGPDGWDAANAMRGCVVSYYDRTPNLPRPIRFSIALTLEVRGEQMRVTGFDYAGGQADEALVSCLRSTTEWIKRPHRAPGAVDGVYRMSWPYRTGKGEIGPRPTEEPRPTVSSGAAP